MRLVVLGLSLSSSWGNGHATTYRALLKAFAARGHSVAFLERDVPWYAGAHRDLVAPDFCELVFYQDLQGLSRLASLVQEADAVLVGSYVPDGVAVGDWAQATARGPVAFYDIDTPITLAKLEAGEEAYLSAAQIPGYDLYFSFTGGPTLQRLEKRWGSPGARALYCSADPEIYRPMDIEPRWDLSYLGTYSADRQPGLERLLLEPARRAPQRRFAVAGAMFPPDIDWPANVERLQHVPPADHAAFYAASRFTLNLTRRDMVQAGWSPSVRLFEAAACAVPVISDSWPGLDSLFRPAAEIILASGPDAVLASLAMTEPRRRAIATAANKRFTNEHTAIHRAEQMEHDLIRMQVVGAA